MAAGFEDIAQDEARRLIREAEASGAEALDLSSLRIVELPRELIGLTRLRKLDLSLCRRIRDWSLLAQLRGLESLTLDDCGTIADLGMVAGLDRLRHLSVGGSEPLIDVGGVLALDGLQTLSLRGCGLRAMPSWRGLARLRRLDLSYCVGIERLDAGTLPPTLEALDLSYVDASGVAEALCGLPALRSLRLTGSPVDELLASTAWAALAGLEELHLDHGWEPRRLGVLAGLMALRTLAIRWGDELDGAEVLARLPALRSLDLSGVRGVDWAALLPSLPPLAALSLESLPELERLDVLAGQTALESLDLSGCDRLVDVGALRRMPRLEALDLGSCVGIADLSPVWSLPALRRLNLNHATALRDLDVLSALPRLEHLLLADCAALRDASGVQHLPSLETLSMPGCAQVQAIERLRLPGCLRVLRADPGTWRDPAQLAPLTRLRTLSGCALPELSVLAAMPELRELDTRGSGAIDATALAGHPRLCEWSAMGTALDCSPDTGVLHRLPRLQHLVADTLVGAPRELASTAPGDSCLERLEAWQRDLRDGAVANHEVKVFVLGNGRVGKTQVCRRLSGLDYDDTVPSTHGVQIERVDLLPARGDRPATVANLWDFGGQDIYLGTHALFLDDRAVYLIAWSPAQENEQETVDAGVRMRNKPLAYWLDYVRSLAGPAAPVIVLQSQCDREEDAVDPPVPPDHGFARLQRTACSARNEDGLERLWPELKSAVRLLQQRYESVRLPAGWVRIGEALRGLRGRRSLEREEFDRLCSVGHGSTVPEVVLQYLHGSGQVFWREGVFGNRVVLDQSWALEGIYAVLVRGAALPLIRRQGGLFTRELLAALAWDAAGYSAADQELFLSMMVQCGTCFRVAEGSYLAPELLPDEAQERPRAEAVWRGARPDARARLDYAFLHEGVLKAVLCAIGARAGARAVYWRYGVAFFDGEKRVTVRLMRVMDADDPLQRRGSVVIEAAGDAAGELVDHLVASIAALRIGQPPQVRIEAAPLAPVSSRAMAGLPPPVPPAAASPAAPLPAAALPTTAVPFSQLHPAPLPPAAGEAPFVHVSYAWGGASERLVDALEAALAAAGIPLRRDKAAMRPGDWISRFMHEIGRSRCVLVVISAKYLRSAYCLRELLHLHQSSLGERDTFMERLVPLVLPDAPIASAVDRLRVVRHWTAQRVALEEATAGLDPLAWGASTREELLLIRDFEHHVADILAWLADTLLPQGLDEFDAGACDAAVALVAQRIAKLR